MGRRGSVVVYVLIGVLAAAALGLTTDQIWNAVYDSSSTSLKVKVVAGSAVTPAGNVNDIQIKASATALGAYAGTGACGAGSAITALSSAGAATCTAFGGGTVTGSGTAGLMPIWATSSSLGDSNAFPILVTNDTVTGTTVNKLAKFTSAGRAIITSAAETAGILGVVKGGAGTSGSAQVTTIGGATCISDNATTSGHFVGVSASTSGSCTDLGATFPTSGTQVLGTWTETGAAGARTMFFNTSDVASASAGGGGGGAKNPGGAAGDVQYRDTGNNFAAEAALNYSATNDNLVLANATTSANNTISLNSTTLPTGNRAYVGTATGAATGDNYGGVFQASGTSGRSIAMFAKAAGNAAGDNIAVLGNAANSTEGTNLKNVAILGTLNSSLTTGVNGSFAGLFDGGTLPDANSNVLRVRGTAFSGTSVGTSINITSAGSAAATQFGTAIVLGAGYTGSSVTYAASIESNTKSTGTALGLTAGTNPGGNVGTYSQVDQGTSGSGNSLGFVSQATLSTGVNIGLYGRATGTAAGTNVGVLGHAHNSTEATDLKNVSGYFTLNKAADGLIAGSNISVALLADNGNQTDPIFNAYDNGSLVFSITDGGPVTMTSTLTSSRTTDFGWTVQSAANQACNSTCVSACVVGTDSVTAGFLACTDATADVCLCAGSS